MNEAIEGKQIVVWFSCGIASAVAAKKTLEIYGKKNTVRLIYNPVAEEDSDNLRFLKDCENWFLQAIEIHSNPAWPTSSIVDVFKKKRYISGIAGAPCTTELKKGARYYFEKTNEIDFHVLGFTADEKHRHKRFVKGERPNVLPVLIDLNLAKEDCMRIAFKFGIEPPRVYSLGFSNANCIGCVKSSSPTYWNLVRKHFPKIFNQRAAQSREIGCKLVRLKGKRVFLDQLPENAKGGKLKTYNIECGIFCSETED